MATPTQGPWFIPCIWTKPDFLTPRVPSPRAPASPAFLYLWWNCSAPQCFLHLPHCARAHTLIWGWHGISITEPGLEFHDGPFQAHLLPLPLRTLALSQADSYPPGFQLPLPHSQHFQNGECLSHPQGLEPAPPFMSAHMPPPLQAAEDALQKKWTLFLHRAGPQHTLPRAWERKALCGEHLEGKYCGIPRGTCCGFSNRALAQQRSTEFHHGAQISPWRPVLRAQRLTHMMLKEEVHRFPTKD